MRAQKTSFRSSNNYHWLHFLTKKCIPVSPAFLGHPLHLLKVMPSQFLFSDAPSLHHPWQLSKDWQYQELVKALLLFVCLAMSLAWLWFHWLVGKGSPCKWTYYSEKLSACSEALTKEMVPDNFYNFLNTGLEIKSLFCKIILTYYFLSLEVQLCGPKISKICDCMQLL